MFHEPAYLLFFHQKSVMTVRGPQDMQLVAPRREVYQCLLEP
jgi:hypothetical protein